MSKGSMQQIRRGEFSKMSTEQRFQAAVNVIQSLPKHGTAPFQPSDELKLKFYAYYKQATEGPNNTPKPNFYNIVSRYKWDAWGKLKDMPKEKAMENYVDELKKIVETMAFSETIGDFYDVLGPFFEFACHDEDKTKLMNGDVTRDVMQENNSTPVHVKPIKKPVNDMNGEGPSNGFENGNSDEIESDGDEFSDTYDHIAEDISAPEVRTVPENEVINARGETDISIQRVAASGSNLRSSTIRPHSGQGNRTATSRNSLAVAVGGGGSGGHFNAGRGSSAEVNEQLALAVIRLQQSMDHVINRLDSLENSVQTRGSSGWWPVSGASPSFMVFLLSWPFIAHLIISYVQQKRKK